MNQNNSETKDLEKKRKALLEEAGVEESSDESRSSEYTGSESESEEEEDDEEKELLYELEKIKKERQAEKELELEKQLAEEEEKSAALKTNPLLNHASLATSKRKWDDDVIFRNQATTQELGKPNKRFINDMIRSDFHKKFMNRYIK